MIQKYSHMRTLIWENSIPKRFQVHFLQHLKDIFDEKYSLQKICETNFRQTTTRALSSPRVAIFDVAEHRCASLLAFSKTIRLTKTSRNVYGEFSKAVQHFKIRRFQLIFCFQRPQILQVRKFRGWDLGSRKEDEPIYEVRPGSWNLAHSRHRYGFTLVRNMIGFFLHFFTVKLILHMCLAILQSDHFFLI